MPKKSPPPTYIDQLLSELADIETPYAAVLDSFQVRARHMSGEGFTIIGHPWAWEPSTPDIEARRMKLLRQVRDWAPRFRLLFPHPTPAVQRSMDDECSPPTLVCRDQRHQPANQACSGRPPLRRRPCRYLS
ncbi:hypothetical protein ACFRR7_34945 [Streptomyces sp. NPDC056909]|uniref:hypothetical protein n=1 Tax=Streptomyces sp. NPDC056909 TaxID=3345963 RepID=UPI0036BE6C92